MAMILYLIRHGETEGGEVRRYKGSIDVPLSVQGIEQMKRLTEKIRSNHWLDGVYCSDLIRALRSAEIIARPYGLTPVAIPELRERSFGIWEGMSFDEIRERYPHEFDAWAENPLKYSPMEGESTLSVSRRCLRAFREITRRHRGGTIAIVAHGSINRIILCRLLGVPLRNIFRIEQDFGAFNVIEISERYPIVKLMNG